MSSVSEIRLINADSLCWKIIPDPRVASKNQSETGTVGQRAKDAFNGYMGVPRWAAHAIQAPAAGDLRSFRAERRRLVAVRLSNADERNPAPRPSAQVSTANDRFFLHIASSKIILFSGI
jgi:hypothetical protein